MSSDAKTEISTSGKQGHLTFVEFLFSLAAAEIAMRFATVFDTGADWWSWNFLALNVHLLMSLILIAASYLGWQKSEISRRDTAKISSLISWEFLELLLDVVLVTIYFILVHLSEIPIATATALAGNAPTIAVSMIPEAVCVPFVFVLYLIWDVISKLPSRIDRKTGRPFGPSKLFRRGRISCVVATMSVTMSAIFWDPTASAQDVIAFDFAIIGLVVLFRELKEHVDDTGICFALAKRGYVSLGLAMFLIPSIAMWFGWTTYVRSLLQSLSDMIFG